MDDNSFLMSFGLDPKDFCRSEGPISSDEGWIYEAWEARKAIACPACGSMSAVIKAHYVSDIKLRSDVLKSETLVCHRIKYVCKDCGKTFTSPLKGAMVGRSISYQERALMLAELNSGETFAAVARKHGVSETHVVSIFDAAYPEIARKPLPKILLIDEFKFRTEYSKYCCHLVDFERSETVDVVRSRQKAHLDEYFGHIGEAERKKVKVVVTDMYDEYAALATKWLPNAEVIVDRFHVVKQLTEAVNRLRVVAMGRNEHDRLAYSFMKSKWRLFLMRKKDIPDKFYVRKSDGCRWHFDDLVRYCLSLDADLANAYDCLQDLFHYTKTQDTFENAVKGIDFVARKLENCRCPILLKVASTYRKWKTEIARGLAKNDFGAVLTNGRMEAANNVAQTLIDAAYGYRNFERFRKRFLLIRWHKR